MMLLDSSDPFVALAAPSWPPGGSGPHWLQLSKQRQHSDTETLWADCRRGGVVLAWGPWGQHTSLEQGHSISETQASGPGGTSRRGSGKARTSCDAGKARAVDGMGRKRRKKIKISWKELWEMEAFRASFTIRAAYDVLPSPANLS